MVSYTRNKCQRKTDHWNQSMSTKTSRRQKRSGEQSPRGWQPWRTPRGGELPDPSPFVHMERGEERDQTPSFPTDTSPLLSIPLRHWAMMSPCPGQLQSLSLSIARPEPQRLAVILGGNHSTAPPHPPANGPNGSQDMNACEHFSPRSLLLNVYKMGKKAELAC